VKSFPLAPGQSVVETIDLGPGAFFEGRYYSKISVGTRYGHIPMLTRKESDTRYLGVHVVITPQRECCVLASASSR